jgi:hypothetical protein
VIAADDLAQGTPGHVVQPIPSGYWNLAGAMYAYIFGELTQIGIDVTGESQLVGFPTQFPSVSMVDWNNGKPNARFWVLKLIHDNFSPGDQQVEIQPFDSSLPSSPYIYSLAFVTRDGRHRILLINKRDRKYDVTVPGANGGQLEYVDQTTGFKPPATLKLNNETLSIAGYSVAVLTMP